MKAPPEYNDLLLCRLYRCTPSELDEQSWQTIDLHTEFLALEEEERKLKKFRDAQKK